MTNPFLKGLQEAAAKVVNSLANMVQRLAAPNTLSSVAPIHIEFTADVVRSDDLLVVTFGFANLRLIKGNLTVLPRLVPLAESDSYLILVLPPQSISPTNPKLSKPSTLVFRLKPEQLPLNFTIDALLTACENAEPVISSALAAPLGHTAMADRIHLEASEGIFTALEVPYRLVISPAESDGIGRIALPHADASTKHTPIWHIRLKNIAARAVWSNDLTKPDETSPTLAKIRAELVRHTGDQRNALVGGTLPTLHMNWLMLSALGTSLQADYLSTDRKVRSENSFSDWIQIISQGHDELVAIKVVTAGYLLPFGHSALIVEGLVRESAMTASPKLVQRRILIVGNPRQQYARRDFPLSEVRLTQTIWRNLSLEAQQTPAFWLQLASEQQPTDATFGCEALDKDGNRLSFNLPMMFVAESLTDPSSGPLTSLKAHIEGYNNAANKSRRSVSLEGQRVSLAQGGWAATLSARSITLGAIFNLEAPYFAPVMRAMEGTFSAAQALGNFVTSPLTFTVEWEDTYAKQPDPELFGNGGEVFAKLVDPIRLRFDGARLSGLFTPDVTIEGLSCQFGMVSDLQNMRDGLFIPARQYDGVKLLGEVQLKDVLSTTDRHDAIPSLRLTERGAALTWHAGRAHLRETGYFLPGEAGAFYFTLETGDSYHTETALEDFRLMPRDNLITIDIKRLAVSESGGLSRHTELELGRIQLRGSLSLLQPALDGMPTDGFSHHAHSAASSHVGHYTVVIPAVQMGLVTLRDLSLMAMYSYGDAPLRVRLVGRSVLWLEFDLRGVRLAEAALESTAQLALKVGNAYGTGSVIAGVYLHFENDLTLELYGFVAVHAMFATLGVVGVSAAFVLPIHADANTGKLSAAGRIQLIQGSPFFHKSVTLSISREWRAAPATESMLIRTEDWAEYCAAFAE